MDNKEHYTEELYGVKVPDPYRWLEEDNDAVSEWVCVQNAKAHSILDILPHKEKLRERLRALFRITKQNTPTPRNGRYFYWQRNPDQDLSVLYVKEGLQGMPKILIDQNMLSKDHTTQITDWLPTLDGTLLLCGISEAGNDKECIRVMSVDSGEYLPDMISSGAYPHIQKWANDNAGFWYSRRDPNAPSGEEKLHRRIYFHALGTDCAHDALVFGEGLKKEDSASINGMSSDGRFFLITIHHTNAHGSGCSTDIILRDLENNEKDSVVVQGIDALFYPSFHRDMLYIETNHNAPCWKLMGVRISDAARGIDAWSVIIPETKNILLGYQAVRDRLFVETMENVYSRLQLYTLAGDYISDIPLPGLGVLGGQEKEKEGAELFFGFSSFFMASVIYRFDLSTGACAEYARTEVGFDIHAFETRQEWYASKDGTRIPLFLVHKKGLKKDGANPMLAHGYGGFNKSSRPGFKNHIIPFLEDGGIYAEINIRGGGEFGEEWHRQGMRENKQNSFDDFIAALEYCINEKYTARDKIAIFGWSNGGLLVSAVMAQRPDLMQAVVIGAPVTDMVRYQKFFGGRYWISEYGVAENEGQFKYLIRYSPYHNLKKKTAYPATLIITGDTDDRVHPAHAYKFGALLQENNSGGTPILIRIETKAGHGGAAGVGKSVNQYADILSFIYWQLGIKSE